MSKKEKIDKLKFDTVCLYGCGPLEIRAAKRDISQFELDVILDKLIEKVKIRKNNKNHVGYKELRQVFNDYVWTNELHKQIVKRLNQAAIEIDELPN